jgi:hypothetical protein
VAGAELANRSSIMRDRPPLDARLLRAEPFRIFFPLAFLLGVAGVGHWILYTTGGIAGYLGLPC